MGLFRNVGSIDQISWPYIICRKQIVNANPYGKVCLDVFRN